MPSAVVSMKPLGSYVPARGDELGKYSGNEADNDSPENAEHGLIPP